MAKFHDSGTVCKATKRPCPLGDDAHIEAENIQDFENKLAEKMQSEIENNKTKPVLNYENFTTEELIIKADDVFGSESSKYGFNREFSKASPEEKSKLAQAMITKLKGPISIDELEQINDILSAAQAKNSLNDEDLSDTADGLAPLSFYGLETESWVEEIYVADQYAKLKDGQPLINYGASDTKEMRRYGTSATVNATEFDKDGNVTELSIDAYDGNDLKPDVLIGDSVAKLKRLGITGYATITITSKYGMDNINAYDPEDEDSSPADGGLYNIEVTAPDHPNDKYGLYASVNLD